MVLPLRGVDTLRKVGAAPSISAERQLRADLAGAGETRTSCAVQVRLGERASSPGHSGRPRKEKRQ